MRQSDFCLQRAQWEQLTSRKMTGGGLSAQDANMQNRACSETSHKGEK